MTGKLASLIVAASLAAFVVGGLGLPLLKMPTCKRIPLFPSALASPDSTLTEPQVAQTQLSFRGDLEPYAEVQLSSKTEGQIVSINVKKGDVVKKGDFIAQLDYEAKQVRHELLLAQAKSTEYELEVAKVACEKALVDLRRYRRLHRSEEGAIIPAEELERYEFVFKTADLTCKLREAQLELRKLQVAEQGIVVEYTKVVAPISGIIAESYLEEGEMALIYGRGPEKPAIVKIVNIDKVILRSMMVEARLIPQLKEGQHLPVRVDLFPDQTHKGTLVFVSPVVNGATNTVTIEVELDNADHHLRPGMQGEVLIEVKK